jgi:hypothetical protein
MVGQKIKKFSSITHRHKIKKLYHLFAVIVSDGVE